MKNVLMVLLLICLAGCEAVEREPTSGWIKWSNAPDPTAPDWTDEVSQYDWVAFSSGAWNTQRMIDAAAELRQRNPDIKLGEYFHVMAIGQWVFRSVGNGAPRGSWSRDYFDAVTPYLARTNGIDPATGEHLPAQLLPEPPGSWLHRCARGLLCEPRCRTAGLVLHGLHDRADA